MGAAPWRARRARLHPRPGRRALLDGKRGSVLAFLELYRVHVFSRDREEAGHEWLESGRRAMERLAELHRQGKTIRDHPFRTHDMEDVAMDEDAPETWVEGKGWVKV